MKTKLSLIFAFIVFFCHSQNIEGSWKGELDIQGMKLPLILNIKKNGNTYTSTADSPKQGAKGIPVDKTEFLNNELVFEIGKIGASYKGKLNNGIFEGNFQQGGMTLPLNLSPMKSNEDFGMKRPQTPKPPYSYDTEDVTFINPKDKNTLAGTIAQPKNFDKKSPILVMITGSGSQNRNEELFGHQPFAVIADDFAKKGIATLRLDDRGIGGSSIGSENDTSYNFATDISSAVDFLVAKGYKNIGLIGHSEGGMIAPMTAKFNKNVKFLVLMAAPGTPIDQLLVEQGYLFGKLAGAGESQLSEDKKRNIEIYSFIKNYAGNQYETDFKKFLQERFNSINESEKNQIITQTKSAWFRYFIKFNPSEYLSQLKISVLAINGSLDSQVPPKENLDAIKNCLTKAGNKNFETKELQGLNHLFQECKTGSFSEYSEIEQTISPMALDIMSSWILQKSVPQKF